MKTERGAILIMVAVCLLVLMLFSAFVIDQGILLAARGHAQTAADAGAHAAAVSLLNDPSDPDLARLLARKTASLNAVWNETPADVDILVDLPIPCPPGSGGGGGCVRVAVMRGGTDRLNAVHTNDLPTIFARLAGINTQAINATATAQVSAGNAVQCIKPWAVADKWTDTTPDTDVAPYYGDAWDRDDTWDVGDSYTTVGFNPTFDTGYQMPLKPGTMGSWSAGWAMEIQFPGCTGGSCYQENIETCPSWVPTVGIWNPTAYATAHPTDGCDANNDPAEPAMGCINVHTGMTQGPTSHGVDHLVGQDPGATWVVGDDPNTIDVEMGYVNSPCMAAQTCEEYGTHRHLTISPRIVPIAIFDTGAFTTEICSGGGCMARIVNLGGFFIEGMCDEVYPSVASRPAWCGSPPSEANKVVIGRFMKYPGQFTGQGGPTTSSFAEAVRLVR